MSVDAENGSIFNFREGGALGVLSDYLHSSDAMQPLSFDEKKTAIEVEVLEEHRTTGATTTTENGSPMRPLTPLSHTSRQPDSSLHSPVIRGSLAVLEYQSPPVAEANVSKFDIGLKVIGDLTGKDKVAKIALYALRIIAIYATSFSRLYPGKVDSGNNKYALILQMLSSPRLLLGFISKIFLKKSEGVMNGLSLYRQLLRFGKTPFRVRNLFVSVVKDVQKLKNCRGDPSLISMQLYKDWVNDTRIGDLINVYYGICDELLVLYKLGVLTNKPLRRWAGTHECYSWYMDIILSLKTNYYKLQALNERETSIKLNQQVRIKARQVIKNLQLENSKSSSPIRRTLTTDRLDAELEEISREKRILVLSIAGLLCDFSFDTVDVFHLKVDRRLYLSFGLVSAALGFSKVYIKCKEELQDQ